MLLSLVWMVLILNIEKSGPAGTRSGWPVPATLKFTIPAGKVHLLFSRSRRAGL